MPKPTDIDKQYRTIAPVAADVVYETYLAGEDHPRMQIRGDGQINMGGGSAAPDATIARSGSNALSLPAISTTTATVTTLNDGTGNINLSQLRGINDLRDVVLTATIADVSTMGTIYLVSPFTGSVVGFRGVLHGAITDADAAITLGVNGTPVTGGALTAAYDGSAAGDTATCTITGANSVSAGQYISVATDGGSTGTVPYTVVVVIRKS